MTIKRKGGRGEGGVAYSWQHIVSYLLTQKLLQINIKVFALCASSAGSRVNSGLISLRCSHTAWQIKYDYLCILMKYLFATVFQVFFLFFFRQTIKHTDINIICSISSRKSSLPEREREWGRESRVFAVANI